MDNSLSVKSASLPTRVPVTQTSGKSLPSSGEELPISAKVSSVPMQQDDAVAQEEVSRIAKALVAEFDPADRIEKTEQAVAKLNEILRDRERDLEFSVDETTGRTILKVIHAESGEVIRQIPPEELLQITRTFIEGTGSLIQAEA
ncbi:MULTISPECIES: flagellar protein FlaG [Spongiibacter]|uniref:flagellar protein FlaG n=1 Tax=Spongiibacter TaxID=630749 RepID=UPI001B1C4AD8|nr:MULTISPECIES: flagellar protein FlaG [Spongiibacter]MBO6754552.1 flagellar protein FlaG [Spongiibacter sp.]